MGQRGTRIVSYNQVDQKIKEAVYAWTEKQVDSTGLGREWGKFKEKF